MDLKSSNRDWSLLGWAVVWLLLAGLTAYHGFQYRHEIDSFKRMAATTTGVVTSASQGYQSRDDAEPPSISYRFEVNGAEYTGESEEFIPEGDSVQIRYTPNNPSQNLSESHNENSRFEILGVLFCGGIGLFLFMNGYSERTAKLVMKDKFEKIDQTPFSRFLLVISGAIASYLLFNDYFRSSLQFAIYFKVFVFITLLQIAIFSYFWKKPIVCTAYLGISLYFNTIVLIYQTSDSWSNFDRVIAIIVVITVLNLKPQKLEI